MKKVILYGAGGTGKQLLPCIRKKYIVKCFVDSNPAKWGMKIDGVTVANPDIELMNNGWDYIIISSTPGYDTIKGKLQKMEIDESKIIDTYITHPLESRRIYLKNLADIFHAKNISGACAEAGVFAGDFAKYINQYFPDKKLYLFDTFEGFSINDIQIENEKKTSEAQAKDYSGTSIELVLSKMKNPEQVIIKKGYFPDSAFAIKEQFCFVNLDMDLYQPTKLGLEWFENNMIVGGVILVHDYYSETFYGPKLAVDEFMKENSKLMLFPIGDGISVAICGF